MKFLSPKQAFIILSIVFCSTNLTAQLKVDDLTNTAQDIADIAELITIAADIAETTSYTLDELKECRDNIADLEAILNASFSAKYVSVKGRREWADKVRLMGGNVKLYSSIISNVNKRIKALREELIKQKAVQGEINQKLKEGIANIMKVVSKVPGYGQIADGVAGVFGVSSKDAEFIPITNSVKALDSEMKKKTLTDQLVDFLITMNDINESVIQLRRDTQAAKANMGNMLGYNILVSMPNRSIQQYAKDRGIKVK